MEDAVIEISTSLLRLRKVACHIYLRSRWSVSGMKATMQLTVKHKSRSVFNSKSLLKVSHAITQTTNVADSHWNQVYVLPNGPHIFDTGFRTGHFRDIWSPTTNLGTLSATCATPFPNCSVKQSHLMFLIDVLRSTSGLLIMKARNRHRIITRPKHDKSFALILALDYPYLITWNHKSCRHHHSQSTYYFQLIPRQGKASVSIRNLVEPSRHTLPQIKYHEIFVAQRSVLDHQV